MNYWRSFMGQIASTKMEEKAVEDHLVEVRPTGDDLWPPPRSGHNMRASGNLLYMFGGYDPNKGNKLYNEMWRFNTTIDRWFLMPDLDETAPLECLSSSLVLPEGSTELLVYGGCGFPFNNVSNKLLVYNLRRGNWSMDLQQMAVEKMESRVSANLRESGTIQQPIVQQPSCSDCSLVPANWSELPCPRYGAGLSISPDQKLFLFSGTIGAHFLPELHVFDLRALVWSELRECPEHSLLRAPPSYRHEIVSTDERFYVFGGSNIHTCFGFDVIYSFHFKTLAWDKHTCTSESFTTEHGSDEQPRYVYPGPRRAHTCMLYNEKVYMLGGVLDDQGQNNNYDDRYRDFWVLSLRTMCWSKIMDFPYPIFFHSSAITQKGCLYVFGGINADEEPQRTNQMHRMWIDVPPLGELAWMEVRRLIQEKHGSLSADILESYRVPRHYVEECQAG